MRFRRNRPPAPDPAILVPPEGVPLRLEVAGIGVRMGAQITDILLTGIAALLVLLLLARMDLAGGFGLLAIASLLFFLIRIPYYVLSELAWNGQTLGKRMLGLKVVSTDGLSLSAHALVVRNLMKEAEVFLPMTLLLGAAGAEGIPGLLAFGWVVMALAIPLFDRRRRRLGDMIAGTYVIHLPRPVLLDDLATVPPAATQAERFTFLPHQLDHYGAFELQTLEGILRAPEPRGRGADARAQAATRTAIIQRIRRKIGHAEPIPPGEETAFLRAFYNAQRAHLEQRQLFGDRRADKHHARTEDTARKNSR